MDEELKNIIKETFEKATGTAADKRKALASRLRVMSMEEKWHKDLDKFTKEKKLDKLAKATGVLEEDLEDLQDQTKKNIKEYKKHSTILKNVSASIVGLGKAAYAGEGSISGFTENLRRFGLAGEIVANFGRSLDVNIETYRALAQTGAAFGQSIIQLRQIAADAALPLDDFASLVRQNADNLAALYGSATQGAMAMADLGKGIRDQAIPQLAPLGFTVEEINDTLLLNLERQRRTFNFDANARQQNIQSAINFSLQLDRLAKLTGVQRDELARQIESQMSNERFQAFLGGQTREVGQRLETFAGTIGAISPELAEGFQDLIANAGVPVTEAALALVQNMPEARYAVQNLISGLTTAEGALTSVRDASVRSQERFRKATVTGQVEFLRLQSGIIKLGARTLDVSGILAEQATRADSLTQNLTEFQDASKRLSGAFQGLEAGFLSFIGGVLGAGGGKLNAGITGLSSALMALPNSVQAIVFGFGKTIQYGLTALRDTGPTYLAVRQGVIHGMMATGGGKGGWMTRMGGKKGVAMKGGLAMVGGAAALGGIGIAGEAETDAGKLTGIGIGAAGGALMGAQIGTMLGGPLGTAIGGVAGGLIGGGMAAYSAYKDKRQFGTVHTLGTNTEPATKNLTIHAGERVLSSTEASKFNKLEQDFNLKPLENKMSTAVAELTNANKTLSSILLGLNTSVAVQDRTRKATEDGVRATKSITGSVLV